MDKYRVVFEEQDGQILSVLWQGRTSGRMGATLKMVQSFRKWLPGKIVSEPETTKDRVVSMQRVEDGNWVTVDTMDARDFEAELLGFRNWIESRAKETKKSGCCCCCCK